MSDESADTHSDNAEPSMEDILASIRRIIADDDDASVVNEGAVMGAMSPALSSDTGASTEAVTNTEPVDISDVIAADDGLDDLISDDLDSLVSDDLISDETDLVLELDDGITLEDIEADISEGDAPSAGELLDADNSDASPSKASGLAALAAASLSATAAAGAATAQKLTEARNNPVIDIAKPAEEALDDPLELLLDEETPINFVSKDPDADLLESLLEIPNASEDLLLDDEVLDTVMPEKQTDEDLDLVKSLMADLTNSPLHDADDILTVDEDAASESELVDEILSLSMADEVGSEAEDVLSQLDLDEDGGNSDAANTRVDDIEEDDVLEALLGNTEDHITSDAENTPSSDADLNDLISATDPEEASPQDESSLLKDIAKAAKDDAERSERLSSQTSVGLTTGAGLMIASAGPLAASFSGTKAGAAKSEAADIDNETVDILESLEDVINENAANPESDQKPANDEAAAEVSTADTPPLTEETQVDADAANTDTHLTQETADMPKAAAKKDAIIDEKTEKVTASAFASLNSAVEEKANSEDRGDRIGDLVQEALRPMLKEWLDKNLKTIVERAVTKEVKRISSGK